MSRADFENNNCSGDAKDNAARYEDTVEDEENEEIDEEKRKG